MWIFFSVLNESQELIPKFRFLSFLNFICVLKRMLHMIIVWHSFWSVVTQPLEIMIMSHTPIVALVVSFLIEFPQNTIASYCYFAFTPKDSLSAQKNWHYSFVSNTKTKLDDKMQVLTCYRYIGHNIVLICASPGRSWETSSVREITKGEGRRGKRTWKGEASPSSFSLLW